MRAIKIDVRKKDVYDIEIEPGLEAMYKALECDLVEAVTIGSVEILWIDEEGLLHEPIGAFTLYGQSFSGHGLITGVNHHTGDSISSRIPLSSIQSDIAFIDPEGLPEPDIRIFTF